MSVLPSDDCFFTHYAVILGHYIIDGHIEVGNPIKVLNYIFCVDNTTNISSSPLL